MRHRLFNFLSALSLVLFIGVGMLWAMSIHHRCEMRWARWTHLPKGWHLDTVSCDGDGGRVGIAGERSDFSPPVDSRDREECFKQRQRHPHRHDGNTAWYFSHVLWILSSIDQCKINPHERIRMYSAGVGGDAGVGSSFLAFWLGRLVQRRKLRLAGIILCPACGYDLRASLGRCPECGRESSRAAEQSSSGKWSEERLP